MEIYAKSAAIKENILDKVSRGCNHIEIQLSDAFFNKTISLENTYKHIMSAESNIEVIHTPLLDSDEDISLSKLNNIKYFECVEDTFKLGQMIAEKQFGKVDIIIHNNMKLLDYKEYGILENIVAKIRYLLNTYTKTNLLVENVVALIPTREGSLSGQNGFLFEAVEVVNYFRKVLIRDNIYTVLDVCHALTSIKMLERLFSQKNEPCSNRTDYTLEDYFIANQETIGLIHLASVKGLGLDKLRHGSPYTNENILELKYVMDLYKNYNYTCPITLKVFERNYLKCENFTKTYNTLQLVLDSQIGIVNYRK